MPCYEVIGGVGKGGILVRTGRSLEAAKDTQRLGTGAIIKELDQDGDRMQYRLLYGDGPPVGWVAVTFQDKALVKKLPGPDLQVQEKGSGFGLILEIHCEECFEEALDMMWCISEGNWAPKKPSKTGPNGAPIASDGTQAEAFVPSKRGQYTATIEMVLDKAKANPDEDEDDLQPPAGSFVKRFDCAKETRTTVQNMPTGRTFLLSVVLEVKGKGWLRSHWIRLSTLTVESRKPDLYNIDPFDNVRGKCKLNYCELFVPAGAWSLNTGSTVRCRKCGEKATDHEILNEPAKKVSSSKEDTKPVEGAQVWILALGTRGDQQPYVALGLALQRAGYRVRLFGAAPLQRFAATKGLSVTLAGKDWEEYGLELFEAAKSPDYVCEWWEEAYHEAWKTSDDFMSRGVHKWINHELPVAVKTVLTELKGQEDLPDLFIYNHLGVNAGISAWKTYGIRSIMAGLGTEPFSVTEGRTFGKKDFDNVDNVGVMPVTGETPLRWMSYEKFNEHCLEPDKLFGTSPMIKKLFTNDQLLYAKNWHYTGFWILERDSQVSDATMFGGPDVMKRIADFMAAGPAPVYMGWGSMTKVPGKQMLRVGIGALKALGLRGIVSRGWAKLSEELLSEAVGDEDTDGLVAFAKANVLFVDKAPHEWLFPRCACTVHHGGAGTTAASLRAGVPVVITPIVYDQFEHARWVMQLGSGIGLRDLEQVDVTELEEALRKVTSSSDYLDKAKEVQKLIMEEDGAQGAVDAVTLIIRDQVRNGWAKKKWTAEKEKDKEDYDKWMKEEMQRRKERVKEMQRQRDPEYKRKKALNVDGKWLVWNSVWHAINTELATRHEGEAKAEYEEKAKLDGDRALKHFDTLIKENAVPLNVTEHIRDQAEAAGKAGASFVTEGQSLTLGDDIFLDDPPREMDTDLWQEMSMAIRVAARAVVEGCLDAHFLRKGNERWTITYDNYDKCKHDKKSKEILAEFEKDWAEKVAPDPSREDAKDGDRKSTPVAKSNG